MVEYTIPANTKRVSDKSLIRAEVLGGTLGEYAFPANKERVSHDTFVHTVI